MKWITHQATAVAAALVLHLPVAGVAAACAGAVLPDVLDQRMAGLAPTRRGRQKLFNAIHRGTTHWFGWWLVLCAAAFALPGAEFGHADALRGSPYALFTQQQAFAQAVFYGQPWRILLFALRGGACVVVLWRGSFKSDTPAGTHENFVGPQSDLCSPVRGAANASPWVSVCRAFSFFSMN